MSTAMDDPTAELERREDIEVARLYGSMAREEETAASDIDLAIAFAAPSGEPWERVDALRAALQAGQERRVSVLDINRAPTPLACNVISVGRVLVCNSLLRLHSEEHRVWSLWEEYRGHHERIRTAP